MDGETLSARRREWTGLAVLALPTLLIAMDATVPRCWAVSRDAFVSGPRVAAALNAVLAAVLSLLAALVLRRDGSATPSDERSKPA